MDNRINVFPVPVSLILLVLLKVQLLFAAPVDYLKTFVGIGQTKENLCSAALRTVYQDNIGVVRQAQRQQFSLNSFGAAQASLRSESTHPRLLSGFAHFEGGEVIEGSLSTTEVKDRMDAVLRLVRSDENEDYNLEKVIYSLSGQQEFKNFFAQFSNNLSEANEARRMVIPINLIHSSLYLAADTFFALLAIKNQDYASIFSFLTFHLYHKGFIGMHRASSGYNAADNFEPVFDTFLEAPSNSNNANGKRRYFLLSNSIQLSEDFVGQLTGNSISKVFPWSEIDKQFDILSRREPDILFKLLNLGNKSVWVHTDLLVERVGEEEIELHLLIQFSKKYPKYPKKRRTEKLREVHQEEGVLVPIRIPVKGP